MRRWLIYLLCFLFSACHSNKQSTPKDSSVGVSPVDQIAQERFDDNYIVVYNATKQFALVKSKTKKFSEFGFDITYFVFDKKTNEVIMEDFLKSGYVDWEDEVTIKAINRKLNKDKKRSKEVYRYNVETRIKTEVEI